MSVWPPAPGAMDLEIRPEHAADAGLISDTGYRLAMAEHEYRQAVYDLAAAIQRLNAAHSAYWLDKWQIER